MNRINSKLLEGQNEKAKAKNQIKTAITELIDQAERFFSTAPGPQSPLILQVRSGKPAVSFFTQGSISNDTPCH
jgi:hypothetical protein